MTKIGFIGTGNMGGAMLKGLSPLNKIELYAYDIDIKKIKNLSCSSKINICTNTLELAEKTDYIILAVKPYLISSIIQEIKPKLCAQKCIISIAAGVNLKTLIQSCEKKCACIRVMPNTPALVGKGVFALCFDDPNLNKTQKNFIFDLFSHLGTSYILSENYFDAFTALIGSGPAFVFLILESFIQAGVTLGFTAEQSKQMIIKLFEGSLELTSYLSNKHLSELKDMVTSPGGTTVYGLNSMEFNGLKKAIIEGIIASYKRSKEL
ncbi:pyrroline-5-carboxylate reductase [Desulfonauticus submarinus]